MVVKEKDCNGCEHCIQCNKERIILKCDKCKGVTSKLYRYDEAEYCYYCLEDKIIKECSNDIFYRYFEDICKDYDVVEVEND